MMDWSHGLLCEEERILWRRLSVFAGDFTLEAAEEISSGDGIEVYGGYLPNEITAKNWVKVSTHHDSTWIGDDYKKVQIKTPTLYVKEKLRGSRELLMFKEIVPIPRGKFKDLQPSRSGYSPSGKTDAVDTSSNLAGQHKKAKS
jgi:hypothetical protein